MAVTPNSNGGDPLLDLHFLTEEERTKIEKVLREDEDLKTRDRIRLGSVRQELEQDRNHQKLFIGKNQCACCEQQFGRIFNRGTNCPECFHRVCKQCRHIPHQRPPSFICNVCSKKRLLDLQSVDYMPLLLGSKEPPPLYGTELVLKSLEASSASGKSTPLGKQPQQPPELERETPPPLPRPVGSIASSIVVKYDDESPDPEKKSSLAEKVSPAELSESEEEEEEEKPPRQEPPPTTAKFLKRSDSANSMTSLSSMYSAACGKGDYDVTGEIQVGVWYKEGQLFVRVVKAKGLAIAKKTGFSDPYVKMYLLPDKSKHTKRKTGVQRKTTNPNYNEILKTKVPQSDLKLRTLWLSVWDWDRFGRNQFLGEVSLPLSQLDLTSPQDQWYTLHEKVESDVDSEYRGRLQVGLMFSPRESQGARRGTRGYLHILIKQAEELPIMDPHGLTDATVKCYLLPNRSSHGKRKTTVIKNNLNPIWEEQFTYDVTLEELSSDRVLEVTVWDYDRRGSNDFIGGLHLGPAPSKPKSKEWMDSIEEEVTHWEAMRSHPGEWVVEWHVLRPSMDPIGAASGYKPPLPPNKSARPPELSPVQEATSTPELSPAEDKLPTLEMYSFTPPPPPEASSTHPSPSRVSESDVPVSPSTPTIVITEEEEEKPKKEPSELLKHHSDVSFGSMTSIYSDAGGGKGDYDITGEVLMGVYFKDGHLVVHVNRAKGLAAADSNGLSDPYVKTYLLPDKSKHSKRKTAIKRKTLNPVYNEILKYKVSQGDLHSRTLWLSVWDWDRFGRNQFLGEVRLLLSQLDLTDTSPNWYILQDKDESGEGHKDAFSRGELKLGMMFSPTETKKGKTIGTLTFVIKQARDLPNMDSKGLTDGFVKCYLLPDKSSSGKRKTSVIKNNLNPVWEERFSYEKVNLEELSRERVLEVTVWDLNRGSSNDFIGGLRLGPTPGRASRHKEWMDSIGDEVTHWESVLSQPGKWVEQWHTLRTTMDPRDIDLSSCPPPEPLPSALVEEEFPTTETTGQGLTEESLFGPKIKIVGHKETELLKPEVVPSKPAPSVEEPQASGPEILSTVDEPARIRRSSPVVTEVTARRPKKKTTSPPKSPYHETSEQTRPTPPPPTIEKEFHKVSPLSTHQHKTISNESSPSESPSLDSDSRGSSKREARPPVDSDSRGSPKKEARPPVDSDSRGSPKKEARPPVDSDSRGSPKREARPPVAGNRGSPPKVGEVQPLVVPTVAVTATSSHESLESHEDDDTLASLEAPSPLRKTGLLHLKHHDSASSFGSMTSIYSDAGGGKGDYDITGEVLMGIYFKDGHLVVHVNRAKGLAAANSNGLSDPYVKTYLLPDKSKHSKRKTAIKRKTLNPVYNEILKYKVSQSGLHSRTLWMSVWDWDRFGRNQFLGEVRLPLSQLDLTDSNDRWHILQDRADVGGTETYRGQLKMAMMFSPTEIKKGKTKGTLTFVIKQARDLPNMDSKGLTDGFVKCYLLPDKSSSGKRKTSVIKNNLNPVWEERFSYEKVNLEELSRERVLEVTVWDLNRGSSNDFIGGLRLGPTPGRASRHKEWMDSIGDEVTHWESVLSQPGKWVEQWHTLRTTMDPRSVALE